MMSPLIKSTTITLAILILKSSLALAQISQSTSVSSISALCDIYSEPSNTTFDPERALPICQKAAEQGSVEAEWRLCGLYARGLIGDGQDLEKAANFCRLAGEGGHSAAAYQFANMVLDGNGVEQDQSLAISWFQRAANLGNEAAESDLETLRLASNKQDAGSVARLYYSAAEKYLTQNPPRVARAAQWMKRSADLGLDTAQLEFGKMMLNGEGTAAPQPDLGASYLSLSAQQGNSEAMFVLGVLIAQRATAPSDISKGIDLIKRAARDNFVPAVAEYGHILAYGIHITKDEVLGAIFLKRAAEAGFAAAEYNYGIALYYGRGVGHSLPAALGWLTKAAEADIVEAQFALGRIYLAYSDNDDPKLKNPTLARKWLLRAASADFSNADLLLGDIDETDGNSSQNKEAARAWYLKAAELGNPSGAYDLAKTYRSPGADVLALQAAYKWANIAASFFPDNEIADKASDLRNRISGSLDENARYRASLDGLAWFKKNFPEKYDTSQNP